MIKPFFKIFKDSSEDRNVGISIWREKQAENSIYLAIYLWWISLYIGIIFIQKNKKVKCTYAWNGFLTEGKVYETTGIDNCGQLPIICDNGQKMRFNTYHFENDNGKIVYIK